MEWIKCSDYLPKISYLESDDYTGSYDAYNVLVACPDRDITWDMCVAYLCKVQDEEKWNDGDLYWEIYIPGDCSQLIEVDFEEFTHWMPLPDEPITLPEVASQ